MQSFSLTCRACGAATHPSQTYCRVCGQPLTKANNSMISPPDPPAFPGVKKVLKQRYRLLFEIGKGGMGTVYMGKDMQLGNRLVAIKEMSQSGLLPSEKLRAARNFQSEAHLLAGLQHPNLPGIYDHFEENQRWYLVMSYVKGQTLEEYLQARGGKLPVQEVIQIGIVLCNVLQYLHHHHPPIIFRDLKPSNIMRTADGDIYLIDFGIARFFKPGQSKDTTDQGSPGYAAPEQYGQRQTTPGSDIYSLGVILYQAFSGFDIAFTTFNFPPLDSLVPEVPQPLATLITRMIDMDERKRPQNVEMIKLELQNFARDASAPSPLPAPGQYRSANHTPPTIPIRRKSQKGLLTTLSVVGIMLILLAAYALRMNTSASYTNVASTNTSNTPIPTLNNTDTPLNVVATFCHAMNADAPDFQTAYNQFSRQYQSKHSLIDFQSYFQGTSRCLVASAPDANNMAGLSITIACPFRPGPPPGGGPPPYGSPPPGGGPPPDGHHNGPPPAIKKPTNLTLIHDGSNGWKIATISVVDYHCGSSSNIVPTHQA